MVAGFGLTSDDKKAEVLNFAVQQIASGQHCIDSFGKLIYDEKQSVCLASKNGVSLCT
jgi:hypothetical protein